MTPSRTALLLSVCLATATLAGCLGAPEAGTASGNEEGDDTAMSPSAPGHAGFAAIQEVVALLEADPSTDWSKVDLDALRQHLVDMDEVTLRASAVAADVPGGVEVTATGDGATVGAIQRMVSTHASMPLDEVDGWEASVAHHDAGLVLTVTANTPDEVKRIRGLGFFGLMATGAQHPAHHLMMAKGEMSTAHHAHGTHG